MKVAYRARNKDGEVQGGVVVAADLQRAEQLLAENGFTIVSLEEQKDNFFENWDLFGQSISNSELVLFSRQLATLIAARVPIIQALRILQDQIDSKYLLSVTRDLIAAVENGESLSLAMSRYPKVFSTVYVALVRSGEVSGSLDRSLTYLADQLEKDYEIRSKVKTSLTYPGFVVLTLGFVGILMFKFVLPKLTAVLEEQGGELPMVSRYLIAFSKFFDSYWWLVLLLLAGLVLFTRWYVATGNGRAQWDDLKIRLPIVGPIFREIYLARFSRNLATLIAGGIPIIKSLEIVGDVMANVTYQSIVRGAAQEISNGRSVSEGLSGHPFEFPPIVTQTVRVGEQSAQLDGILLKLAGFYEKEIDSKIGTLTTLIEPVIMVVLGVGVGLLVAGVLLPIYNLASSTV